MPRVRFVLRIGCLYNNRTGLKLNVYWRWANSQWMLASILLTFRCKSKTKNPKKKNCAWRSDGDVLNVFVSRRNYLLIFCLQRVAQHFANQYNELNPPKKVSFVDAFVVQLTGRSGSPYYAAEALVKGPYIKHSDNYGFVNPQNARSTPHAFRYLKVIIFLCLIDKGKKKNNG